MISRRTILACLFGGVLLLKQAFASEPSRENLLEQMLNDVSAYYAEMVRSGQTTWHHILCCEIEAKRASRRIKLVIDEKRRASQK